MQADNSHERKKKFITLGILLFITVGLIALLLSSLSNNTVTVPVAKSGEDKNAVAVNDNSQLLQLSDVLQEKLAAIQQSDKVFSASLTAIDGTKLQGQLNTLIKKQEQDFNNAIEEARLAASKVTDEKTKAGLDKMLSLFRSQAESRQAISSLRNAVAMNQGGFSTDEKAVLQLQQELSAKSQEITRLETAVKTASKNSDAMSSSNAAAADNNAKALSESISQLEAKVAGLTAANSALKQDNDKLEKQQTEAGKTSNVNEVALKERAGNLQQKVESLNAELQLLRVDCNLNRVDATQIISTAKQRKQLLTEASAILTDLSATTNADIKKKVKDKIVRLNQVAANSRD